MKKKKPDEIAASHEAIREEEAIIRKATILTYLSLEGHHSTPFREPNGRVAFRVRGDVATTLAKMQENPHVRVLDWIQRYETIRSIIFQMKTDI